MPEMDTSFSMTPQPAANPLELLSQFATTRNALMQNQVMQAEFEYKRASGSILSSPEVVDPKTNTIDPARVLEVARRDPSATQWMGPLFRDATALQKGQLEGQAQKLTLGLNRAKAVSDALQGIKAIPGYTRADAIRAVERL